ncbi:transposon Tf2-6 polyprotein [Nephila pilipes]|uniref:Transposon Tf2-6 polyprotein n=1 Tax=Nephila pilipes TaxID=299642 RepID=A0A8X6MBH4_NEPPI|nr:transposon Tf2-6 polyprotein [Nephila pilipes]
MLRKYFNCHSPNHLSYNCPNAKKELEHARPSNSEVQTFYVITQKGLPLKDITLGDKSISALIYTGSLVSLIREDVSTKIVDQPKFSKKCNALFGTGKLHVLTKGSFEHDFVLDEDHYSLTWHDVPTEHLNFEAVTCTDILKLAYLNFTQNGVEFHKHDEKAWLMQISELHFEDEFDLSHILDSRIKKK